MNIKTIGSVCSGIEAATVAWKEFDVDIQWFSEIAKFPSLVLENKYPNIPNLGDMVKIPDMILEEKIEAPDLICGGTPCQAFSFAGWKNGLLDDRGNLTLSFVDIINANDKIRSQTDKDKTIVFWENVEGVLSDKTNAFGCFISSLAGLSEAINYKQWPSAGILKGPERNIAWRVLDAKYFGLPQQRKRVYLLAGGKNFYPETVLFEKLYPLHISEPIKNLNFTKDGVSFETFRSYTDCLYSSYGTKWNGNAAAYNGSLYVVQNDKIRRLSPLECERLMGFPDDYTNIPGSSRTSRYQALGNSWAVPVIKWIGKRIFNEKDRLTIKEPQNRNINLDMEDSYIFYDLFNTPILNDSTKINSGYIPNDYYFGDMKDIVDPHPPKAIYISPVGAHGIVRRKQERNLNMNKRLEEIFIQTFSKMPIEKITEISMVQKRGSKNNFNKQSNTKNTQLTFQDILNE